MFFLPRLTALNFLAIFGTLVALLVFGGPASRRYFRSSQRMICFASGIRTACDRILDGVHMGFSRVTIDKYLMAAFIGGGMIVLGLSSTDKWWIAIGGVVLGGTLLFAAIDIYFWFRRRSREPSEPDSPPSKLQLVLMFPLVILIAAALVVLNGSEGIVLAVLLLVAYAVLMLITFGLPSGPIPLGKISFSSGPISLRPTNAEGSPAAPEDARKMAEVLKLAIKDHPEAVITKADGTPASEADVKALLEALDAASAGNPHPRLEEAETGPEGTPQGTVASWNIQLGPEQLKSISVEQVLKAVLGNDPTALLKPEEQAVMDSLQPPDALRVLRAAFSDNPDAILTPAGEAKSLFEDHQYEAALAAVDRAVANRASARELLLRAEILLAVGAPADALGDIDRALQIEPKSTGAGSLRGRVFLESGRVDEAIEHLKPGESGETPPALYFALANAYSRRGMSAEAAQAYEDAVIWGLTDANWGSARDRSLPAAALVHMGKVDAAAEAAGKALGEAPGDPNALYAKALVELKSGSSGAAIAALAQALDTNPYTVVRALSDPQFAPLLEDEAGRDLLARAQQAHQAMLERIRGRAGR